MDSIAFFGSIATHRNRWTTTEECIADGTMAGVEIGMGLCAVHELGSRCSFKGAQELCDELEEAHCELEALWYVVDNCDGLLLDDPPWLRELISDLCILWTF